MSHRREWEPTHPPAVLLAIARYQRSLILCLVAQLALWVGYILLRGAGVDVDGEDVSLLVMGLTVLIGLGGGVVVFRLATKTSGLLAGLAYGVLTVVPCFGLIMLLIVNVQATRVLQAHGVRVGLYGARAADLAALQDGYRYDDIGEDEGW